MDPPTLMISFTGEKDSHENIRATGEFVVNLVTEGQAEVQTATAAITPPSVDEAALLVVGLLVWLFYRDRIRRAWDGAA